MKEYYQLSANEVKLDVNGYEEPLHEEDVKLHKEKFGANELEEGKKKKIALGMAILTAPYLMYLSPL